MSFLTAEHTAVPSPADGGLEASPVFAAQFPGVRTENS